MADDNEKLNPFIKAVMNLPRNYGSSKLTEIAGEQAVKLGGRINNPKIVENTARFNARPFAPRSPTPPSLPPTMIAKAPSAPVKMLGRGLVRLGGLAKKVGRAGASPAGLLTTGLAEIGVDAFNDWNWKRNNPWVENNQWKQEYLAEQEGLKVDYNTGKVYYPDGRVAQIYDEDGREAKRYTPRAQRKKNWLESHYQKPGADKWY